MLHLIFFIAAAETLFVRCFSSNQRRRQPSSLTLNSRISSEVAQNDVAINELRANMAMTAVKNNAISIVASLPPTQDSLFYHCLRTSRQVQIWIQAPDNYIKYPKLEDSGYQIVNDHVQVQWTPKLSFPNDQQLACCGKHKCQCTRCVCVKNRLPCTIFCKCAVDCSNRKLNETVNSNSQIVMKTTTNQTDFSTHHNSKFILSQYDDDFSNEEEKSDQSSASNINCLSDAMEEVSDMVKIFLVYN
ncbi:unnamed protein product [Rotaria magnacalcarata]|uniref:Tesmin/TSO1-like CXC domain-containing protein n=2 Tax=Rotaria magnacalcarata TaxID=392030 RepID=A0A816NTP3_9BILA|nr:unnamed protein product [Rotaria magnacalcarata]CAF4093848.1 unnamed protein product [Rotaria magnacalcarata]